MTIRSSVSAARKRCREAAVIVSLLLAACSPPEALPSPTPQPLTIAITPALQPLGGALQRCAAVHPEIALIISEIPAASLHAAGADLTFSIGPPPGTEQYAAPLAKEKLDIILNPNNIVKSLDIDELRTLFSGKTKNWRDVGGPDQDVSVWVYPPGNQLRQIFDAAIMGDEPVTSQAFLAADSSAMLAAIASHSGAIGYLPNAWLTSKVQPLSLAAEINASLTQPVLASAPTEPQGTARTFLYCLQNGEGKQLITRQYKP